MTGIEGLEKIESFLSTDFAQNRPLGPMAQTGFEEIANCHRWDAGSLLPARLEADEIGLADVDLGRVFDNDQPIFIRNEVGQDIQQGSFPCTGSAADVAEGASIVSSAVAPRAAAAIVRPVRD